MTEKTENIEEILAKAKNEAISPDDALALLEEIDSPQGLNDLFRVASEVRDQDAGPRFKFDGFIGTITPCQINPPCWFCGRAAGKKDAFSSPLSIEEIKAGARLIADSGVKMVEIGGGTMQRGAGEKVIAAVKAVKAVAPGMDIWVNVGPSLSKEDLLILKELDVKEVCSSLEVYNPELFARIKPGDSIDARMKLAEEINSTGLGLTSVMMVGVGATNEEYVKHLFWLRRFENLSHLPITGFRPVPGTPLEKKKMALSIEVAKVGAVARLVHRKIDISFGGIMNDPQLLPLWIMAGANRAIHMGPHIHRSGGWSRAALPPEIITKNMGEMEFRNFLPFTIRMVEKTGLRPIPELSDPQEIAEVKL